MASDHIHQTWDEVYRNLDLSYSEKPETQGKLFELIKLEFLQQIFPNPPAKTLEVGCGTAFDSLYLAKRGYQVTCLDINENILKVAEENFKKEGEKGEFVAGDAEKLPFPTGHFDIIMSFGLLEHFENPEKAISEMVRVLKPEGVFFADIVPDRFSVQSFGNLFNALASFLYWLVHRKPKEGIKKASRNFRPLYTENSISWQDYKKMIKKVGVKNVQVRGNRPFPRLTLPRTLDYLYAQILRPTIPLWKAFDKWNNPIPKVWGAGLWFWGEKT